MKTFWVGLSLIGLIFVLSNCSESPESSRTDIKTLYRFWQAVNYPEPGRYEDELVGGEVLLKCKAANKYPAYFGYLTIRMTFNLFAIKNPEPFKVYVGGIDWGEKIQMWSAPPESGGAGIIGRLELNGCTIPPELEQQARRAIEGKSDNNQPTAVPKQTQAEAAPAVAANQPAAQETSGHGSVSPSSSVQLQSEGNTAKDYQVVAVRQPTAAELVLVHKSSAREFLADGGTVTVASADLNGDGVPEVIVFAHSSMWCGSGGCASKVLMTGSNGNITTYDNDCMYFGDSGKIGVGSNGSGRFASMYPLNDNNTLAIMDKNGIPDTGKPIVCHLAQTQSQSAKEPPKESSASGSFSEDGVRANRIAPNIAELEAALKRKDYATAIRELRPLLEAKEPSAQEVMGSLYWDGAGVEKNRAEAFKYFLLAAQGGMRESQFLVGTLYLRGGDGVPKDRSLAKQWLQKAADQGHEKAEAYIVELSPGSP